MCYTTASVVYTTVEQLPSCPITSLTMILFAESILSLIINPLTLVAMVKFNYMKKSATNLLIGGLYVVDIIRGIAVLCMDPQNIEEQYRVVIWISNGLAGSGFFASLLITLGIGIERLIVTVFPMKRKQMSNIRWAKWYLLCVCVSSLLLTVVPISVRYSYLPINEQLRLMTMSNEMYSQDYRAFVMAPFLLFCLISIVMCYAAMLIAFIRMTKRVQNSSNDRHSRRLTRMVITIVTIMIISCLPVFIPGLINTPDPLENSKAFVILCMAIEFVNMLSAIPTYLNNVIYMWHQPSFRKACAQVFPFTRSSSVQPSDAPLS